MEINMGEEQTVNGASADNGFQCDHSKNSKQKTKILTLFRKCHICKKRGGIRRILYCKDCGKFLHKKCLGKNINEGKREADGTAKHLTSEPKSSCFVQSVANTVSASKNVTDVVDTATTAGSIDGTRLEDGLVTGRKVADDAVDVMVLVANVPEVKTYRDCDDGDAVKIQANERVVGGLEATPSRDCDKSMEVGISGANGCVDGGAVAIPSGDCDGSIKVGLSGANGRVDGRVVVTPSRKGDKSIEVVIAGGNKRVDGRVKASPSRVCDESMEVGISGANRGVDGRAVATPSRKGDNSIEVVIAGGNKRVDGRLKASQSRVCNESTEVGISRANKRIVGGLKPTASRDRDGVEIATVVDHDDARQGTTRASAEIARKPQVSSAPVRTRSDVTSYLADTTSTPTTNSIISLRNLCITKRWALPVYVDLRGNENGQCPRYDVECEVNCHHHVIGSGATRKEAKRQAAAKMMLRLKPRRTKQVRSQTA